MWKLLFIASLLSGVKAKSQVLVTNRGEPAPFPHFPQTLKAEARVAQVEPEAFQFAPTPSGRAPVPTPKAALVAKPQPPPLSFRSSHCRPNPPSRACHSAFSGFPSSPASR